MNRLFSVLHTSLGRKVVVALTGVLLIGFLIAHMLGNMTVLQGRDSMNSYAAWLQGHPLLWVGRIGLLVVFSLHVVTAIAVTFENRRARPVGYSVGSTPLTGRVSRFVVVTGLLAFAFIVYHLLHFTFGVVQPDLYGQLDDDGRHDVFGMTVRGFRSTPVTISYLVAMVILWVHLRHGATSLFQTLGVRHPAYDAILRGGALVVVTLVIIGNITIPLVIWFGWIRP